MKRLAIGFLAAVLGAGAVAPLTVDVAQAQDRYRARPWDRDRDRDDRDGRWDRDRRGRRDRDRDDDRRLAYDPVYQALQRAGSIQVNNFFDGGRYQSSNQVFGPDIVRIRDVNRDGTYDVWFNGRTYTAYSKTYKGKTLLYVGNAPTPQGYLYELILQ
jgi:hypothetical protein